MQGWISGYNWIAVSGNSENPPTDKRVFLVAETLVAILLAMVLAVYRSGMQKQNQQQQQKGPEKTRKSVRIAADLPIDDDSVK